MDIKTLLALVESTTSCTAASYMKTYSGLTTFFRAKHDPELSATDIALVGVPIDAGLTQRPGARYGPREVRNQSCLVLHWHEFTKVNPFALCRITDIGDVPIVSAFDLTTMIDEIRRFYVNLQAAGIVPITVGGDHSISWPILRALGSAQALGLIHIDAHLDTAENIGGSTLHHGSPFWNAATAGVIDPKRTVHIGIRDPYGQFETYAFESGMSVIDINRFHDLGVAGVIEATRDVVGSGPTYISFDVDGLDPAFAPGTGTPSIGGLTSYEARRLLQGLRGLDIVGGDVVEISPPFDSAGITALAGAQMLFEVVCLGAEAFVRRREARE